MRMAASWFGSRGGSTEYKVVAAMIATIRQARLRLSVANNFAAPGAFLAWRIIARHALSPSIPRA
jgi:hypothetical protein